MTNLTEKPYRKWKAHCEFAPVIQIPAGQRVPFGWGTIAIDRASGGTATLLRWPEPAPESEAILAGAAFLRICVACDVREEKRIDAALAGSGRVIGTFDIRYGYVHQIFEIPIPAADVPEVIREGVSLRMTAGDKPLWIFYDSEHAGIPDTFQPHVLVGQADSRLHAFFDQLKSTASIQPFGWLEGCVVDGLYQMDQSFPHTGWREALLAHLNLYFPAGNKLVMEDHFGLVSDDTFYLDESTLPIAVIAEIWPDHPILDKAIAYWGSRNHALTAEGCYTMAYPLTVLARIRNNADLARWAVRLLLERMDELADEHGLWQCYRPGTNADRYRDWARAYAWYMLGMTRSLINLRASDFDIPETEAIAKEIVRMAELLASHQQANGLWLCFVQDASTGPDTSGSAGIAAALAEGARNGILPALFEQKALLALKGLLSYVTSDGLLAGVAQNNRGGEALQKSDYRVISQMAMGLMGQLTAALRKQDA